MWIHRETSGMHMHRDMTTWRVSRRVALCKRKREASEETNFAGILISDFQLSEPWEINVCWATQSMIFCYGIPSRLIQWGWNKSRLEQLKDRTHLPHIAGPRVVFLHSLSVAAVTSYCCYWLPLVMSCVPFTKLTLPEKTDTHNN